MRKFLVKYFALSYETKVGGNPDTPNGGKVPRAALPSLITFFTGVILTLLFEDTDAPLFVLWALFAIVIWIGFPWWGAGYFGIWPIKYAELEDQSQKWQDLHKPLVIGLEDETFPVGLTYDIERRKLKRWHTAKFKGKSNVNVLLGLSHWIITIVGVAICIFLFYAGYGSF